MEIEFANQKITSTYLRSELLSYILY